MATIRPESGPKDFQSEPWRNDFSSDFVEEYDSPKTEQKVKKVSKKPLEEDFRVAFQDKRRTHNLNLFASQAWGETNRLF